MVLSDNKVTLYKALSKSSTCKGDRASDEDNEETLPGDGDDSSLAAAPALAFGVLGVDGVEDGVAVSSSLPIEISPACNGLALWLERLTFIDCFFSGFATTGATLSFLAEDDEAAAVLSVWRQVSSWVSPSFGVFFALATVPLSSLLFPSVSDIGGAFFFLEVLSIFLNAK